MLSPHTCYVCEGTCIVCACMVHEMCSRETSAGISSTKQLYSDATGVCSSWREITRRHVRAVDGSSRTVQYSNSWTSGPAGAY